MKHTITAGWLSKKLKYDGEPRMIIKDKKLLVWSKDAWSDDKPEAYKFLGYRQDLYAFEILCKGKKCTWSH